MVSEQFLGVDETNCMEWNGLHAMEFLKSVCKNLFYDIMQITYILLPFL